MVPLCINKVILYFYGINAAREQFVVIYVTSLLVRLAGVSFSWNTLVDPRAREGSGTKVTLVTMGIMAGANALWRV